jgi:hypothetical protein
VRHEPRGDVDGLPVVLRQVADMPDARANDESVVEVL